MSERNCVLRLMSGGWIAKNEQRSGKKSELNVEQIERRVALKNFKSSNSYWKH